ncbi:isoprenylcysteine carboxylmethyltransferase family protein [Blastococcus sp. MG754426]|uniref:methyltransferase family protein n=1 Tax=unclassified Blastococcus TaxID=2619396 RepID=UPI001EEFE92E|nr:MULTISPECIES: isoprenylcysteine carboxylmethyltransferase family protein [unclassified Blastococcus]MCF6507769.1 isoprenylcysteine carboxylmethyltransferase family protein [Blastococcus sp. MG754426]MCF6510224.1 isoprenylcysteine carboxylmethyltransferase family protein [Blastococcus sp. MG754427]MCF6735890.1 isoprenylcysteine carboxylmethyltransferase family protein [Blastococcus sp. KM273129]
MSVVALALYVLGLVVVFGVRTWVQIRRTGSSGFHGISGSPGSLRWWAGVLFVLALVSGAGALVLAATGVARAPFGSIPSSVAAGGLTIAVLGFFGVVAAQTGMGTSWRIGVDESERTDLVTDGLFRRVRNPIFTAMVIAQVGLTVAVPTWLSVAALVCLVTAVELQVRLIEEPYLLQVHGATYREYAADTGRFLPGIGALSSPAAAL